MDDAYTAGIIDGEGCIRLASSHRGVVTVTVEVTMSYKALPLLQKMHVAYGGKCLRMKRDLRPTRAVTHSWRLIGRPAVEFLRRVQPHLEIKREQAALAIWLQEKIDATPRGPGRGGPWAQELKEVAARAAARMKELNRTGPARRVPARGVPVAILEGGEWVSPQMTIDPISDLFTGPWPVSGTVIDGVAYSLPAPTAQELRLLTADSGSSSSPGLSDLLPTPEASDGSGGRVSSEAGGQRPSGSKRAVTLATKVAHELLPTPTTQPQTGNGHARDLGSEAKLFLPTPTASDRFGPGEHGTGGMDLRTTVDALLPTPIAGDAKSARNAKSGRKEDSQHYSGETLTDVFCPPLMATPRVSASRTSRSAAVRRDSMSAPSLEQCIEIAQGILPREFTSWDELPPSWHGDRMSPPSADGSES